MASKLLWRPKRPPDPDPALALHGPSYPKSTSGNRSKSAWKDTKLAARMALNALKESADAFPPLKSAIGGALYILDLADQAKSNKKGGHDLALRVKGIMDGIADIICQHDPQCLSPDLQRRIFDFTHLLDDIATYMESCSSKKFITRVLHHKGDKQSIESFNRRLDEAHHSFILFSQIKSEIMARELLIGQSDLARGLSELSKGQENLQIQVIRSQRLPNALLVITTGILLN